MGFLRQVQLSVSVNIDSKLNPNISWLMKRQTFYIVCYIFFLILHIEVLQQVKTPNVKPKKISESGSEDR